MSEDLRLEAHHMWWSADQVTLNCRMTLYYGAGRQAHIEFRVDNPHADDAGDQQATLEFQRVLTALRELSLRNEKGRPREWPVSGAFERSRRRDLVTARD